jgi:hypothetical protein
MEKVLRNLIIYWMIIISIIFMQNRISLIHDKPYIPATVAVCLILCVSLLIFQKQVLRSYQQVFLILIGIAIGINVLVIIGQRPLVYVLKSNDTVEMAQFTPSFTAEMMAVYHAIYEQYTPLRIETSQPFFDDLTFSRMKRFGVHVDLNHTAPTELSSSQFSALDDNPYQAFNVDGTEYRLYTHIEGEHLLVTAFDGLILIVPASIGME